MSGLQLAPQLAHKLPQQPCSPAATIVPVAPSDTTGRQLKTVDKPVAPSLPGTSAYKQQILKEKKLGPLPDDDPRLQPHTKEHVSRHANLMPASSPPTPAPSDDAARTWRATSTAAAPPGRRSRRPGAPQCSQGGEELQGGIEAWGVGARTRPSPSACTLPQGAPPGRQP